MDNQRSSAKIDKAAEEYLVANNCEAERATVMKYGFDLRVVSGSFVIADPTIRNGKKPARYTGDNLTVLLHEAVVARRVHLKAEQPEVAPETEASPEAVPEAPEAVSEAVPEVQPEVAPETVPEVVPDNVIPIQGVLGKRRIKLAAEQPKPVEPPKEISGDDIELDNTGQRIRKPKVEKEPRVKQPNRYGRIAELLLDNPDMKVAELSKRTKLTDNAVAYCIVAWEGISEMLIRRNLLKLPD